ncbi:MAG: peptidoglycan editing factor PgeF [Candidatus Moranbacteria bacterium]|nr:peptidoglycan editing factor PgeF [Candidatus Moranbacteria bacterium]
MNIFEHSEVLTFLSERADGNMRLFGGDSSANRDNFLQKNNLGGCKLVSARLVHDSRVEVVGKDSQIIIEKADGLVARQKEIVLAVTVADCLPIYLFDPKTKVCGVLHAGWRSLKKGVIREAMSQMKKAFGAEADDFLAGVGVGIGACHFEVKEDFQQKFAEFPQFFVRKEDKVFFDLKALARFLLIKQGVLEENIAIKPECTYCLEDNYFSFRRDGEKEGEIQAMMAGITVI